MKTANCSPTALEIGNNIRKLRIIKGYDKQKDFADELEISKVSLSKIENGITDIAYSRFCQIAHTLNIDIEIIFKDPAHSIAKKLLPPRNKALVKI